MRSTVWAWVATAFVISSGTARGQCEDKQLAKFTQPDDPAGLDDDFGESVAYSGTRAAIGASHNANNDGAVYVYEKQLGAWVLDAKIPAPLVGGVGGYFGLRVALEGDFLAVSANTAPLAGASTGVVHVFERTGATWNHVAMLSASDAAGGDQFGEALALSGGRVVVGVPSKNGLAGAAYVFEVVGVGWSEVAKLVPTDAGSGHKFGAALDASGDQVVVGAPGATGVAPGSGAAYVFERQAGGWTQAAKLILPNAFPGAQSFGTAVAIDGDRVAAHANTKGIAIFERSGPFWIHADTLTPSDNPLLISGSAYGAVLQLDGDRLLVAAPGDDTVSPGGGAAYLYLREAGAWVERMKLVPEDGTPSLYLAKAMSMSGGAVMLGTVANGAGAMNESAYEFSIEPNPPPTYGHGCPGSGGFTPSFSLEYSYDGCVMPGSNLSFSIAHGLGGGTAILFFGISPAQFPMGAGCDLLLNLSGLNLPVPLFGAGAGNGKITFNATMPVNAPPISIYSQGFIADPGGALGFSATNGVRITVK